jgi:hypothetical protein
MGWSLVLYGWMMDEGWNCKDVFLHDVLSAMREKHFDFQSAPYFLGRASFRLRIIRILSLMP